MSFEDYKRDIYQMQQDLIEQGWDDVEIQKSKKYPQNYQLVVRKTGYNARVLTALQSFSTMWSSTVHTGTSAANMLNTMERTLFDLNRDLVEAAEFSSFKQENIL